MIWLIVAIVLAVLILYQYFNQYPRSKNTVVGYVGTMGAGKTYLAVRDAVAAYKRQRLHHFFGSFVPFYSWFVPTWHYKPTLYSNIPIRLGRNKYSEVFVKDHLLRRKLLPEGAIVLIDEFGQLASQWEFDNPFVREQLADFTRFYRHWIDGRFFLTDQSSENIVKPVRCRLGVIYHLNNFGRWCCLPFFKVEVTPLLMVEDTQKSVDVVTDGAPYFFGILHYRIISKIFHLYRYNSRCYSPLYAEGASTDPVPFDKTLKTRYLIDIACSRAVSREYKQDRAKFRRALYSPAPFTFTVVDSGASVDAANDVDLDTDYDVDDVDID